MQQVRLFELLQVVVNCFVVQRMMLRFQIVGNGLRGEGVADVVEGVFDDTFQLVDFSDLTAADDVGKNCGIVNIAHDGVDFLLRIGLQVRRRKSAETDIVRQLCFCVADGRILPLEHQIFAERQRENAEGDIPPGQVSGDFGGHHAGIRAGDIQVHIKIGRQRIHDPLPSLDFLHFVKEQVRFPFC